MGMPLPAMPVVVLISGRYGRLLCSSSSVLPPPQLLPQLVSRHQCKMGRRELRQAGQGGMGITACTGLCSYPTPSPNHSGRDVVVDLTHVGTTVSGMSTPLVILKVLPWETPSKNKSPPLRPLICGRYPPKNNFVLPLSGWGLRYGCDLAGGGDMFLR